MSLWGDVGNSIYGRGYIPTPGGVTSLPECKLHCNVMRLLYSSAGVVELQQKPMVEICAWMLIG